MFDQELNLRDYVYILRKQRWFILAVFVLVVLAFSYNAFRKTPVYRATVRILVDKESPATVPFNQTYFLNNWDPQYLSTQYKIIAGRDLAARVLEKLGMMPEHDDYALQHETSPETFSLPNPLTLVRQFLAPRKPELSASAQVTSRKQQLLGGFLSRVNVSPVEDSRLVDISIVSTDAEEAALIANTLAETYIEQNLASRIASSRDAVQWLIKEVNTTRQKMIDSEIALQRYKEESNILSFEERQNIVFQKLAMINEEVNQVKFKRMASEAQYNQIQRFQNGQLQTLPLVLNNPVVQELRSKSMALETELIEKLRILRDKHPDVQVLYSQITGVQNQLDAEMRNIAAAVKNEYELLLQREQDLQDALQQQKTETMTLNQKAIQYSILQKEAESNRMIHDSLLQRANQVSVTERLETNNVRIVNMATIPLSPISPNIKSSVTTGMMLGLALGIGLAFFFEFIDSSLKTPEDMTLYLDLPFLGFIPKSSEKLGVQGSGSTPETVLLTSPKSVVAEAYRSLRTSVTFSELEHQTNSLQRGSVLLVTSSEPSEGKSCTVANLGVTIAQSGKKTLIIDCDLRKPTVHRIFQVKNDVGFSDTILNASQNKPTRGNIQRTEIPNLDVIPCGTIPANPSELLSSELTKAAIDKLREQYDTILIDSPPVNVVTDPIILSRLADGVVLIVRAGETRRDLVKRARDQILQAGGALLGGVINQVDLQKEKYYYYYSYYYTHYYRMEEHTTEVVQQHKVPRSKRGKLTGMFFSLFS